MRPISQEILLLQALLNTLSIFAALILLLILLAVLKTKVLKMGSRLVLRTLFIMTHCQIGMHLAFAGQDWGLYFNPKIYHGHFCTVFGMGSFLAGIANFMWALMLGVMLLLLLLGYTSAFLERTVCFQHLLCWGVAILFSLLPLVHQDGYETYASPTGCWVGGAPSLFFYGTCAATFFVHLGVLLYVACKHRTHLPKTSKMLFFLLQFTLTFFVPCSRRAAEVFLKWDAPHWVTIVHGLILATYGLGSLAVGAILKVWKGQPRLRPVTAVQREHQRGPVTEARNREAMAELYDTSDTKTLTLSLQYGSVSVYPTAEHAGERVAEQYVYERVSE